MLSNPLPPIQNEEKSGKTTVNIELRQIKMHDDA